MKPLSNTSWLSPAGRLLALLAAFFILIAMVIHEFDVDGPCDDMVYDSCDSPCDQPGCLLFPRYDW